MSKRAEEAALKAYPKDICGYQCGQEIGDSPEPLDYNEDRRKAHQKGYSQAEKDLALTIDDIERLHTFIYAVKNHKTGQFTFTRLSDEQYQEVLDRFNETRNG